MEWGWIGGEWSWVEGLFRESLFGWGKAMLWEGLLKGIYWKFIKFVKGILNEREGFVWRILFCEIGMVWLSF